MKLIFSLLAVAFVGLASAEIQPLPRAGFKDWVSDIGSKMTSLFGDKGKKSVEKLNELIASTERLLDNAKAGLATISSSIEIPGAQRLIADVQGQLEALKAMKAKAETALTRNKA